MAFEQKDMTGAIFKNEKREKDTHPNMTGSGMIDGRKVYISAWTKEGAKGRFQSLSFKWADEQPTQSRQPSYADRREPPKPLREELSDDIPF